MCPRIYCSAVWVTAGPAPAFAAFCTPQYNRSPTEMGGSGPVLGAAFDHPQLFGSSIYTKFEKAEGLKFVKLLILCQMTAVKRESSQSALTGAERQFRAVRRADPRTSQTFPRDLPALHAPPTPHSNGQRSARTALSPPAPRPSARAQCVAQGGLVDGRLRPAAATMAAAGRVRGVGAPPERGGS